MVQAEVQERRTESRKNHRRVRLLEEERYARFLLEVGLQRKAGMPCKAVT